MRIDAHQHFWRYTAREFDWIGDDMAAIRRDFLPAQLESEIEAAGVDGAISVQARQTLAETEWLLQLANAHDFLCGVVGWLPLREPNIQDVLQRFATDKKFVGARHVVQGEADGFLEDAAFNHGVRALTQASLAYDILIVERQLPQAIAFVDRHPAQVFVLDHIAKPRIQAGVLSPWRENLRELARRENVFCKFSGLVTEADFARWTPRDLQPYWEVALDAFGPSRLMFGSDWPVCLAATEYSRWAQVVAEFAAALSADEQRQLFGATAARAYRLNCDASLSTNPDS